MSKELKSLRKVIDFTLSDDLERERVSELIGKDTLRWYILTADGNLKSFLSHMSWSAREQNYPGHRTLSIPISILKRIELNGIKFLIGMFKDQIKNCPHKDITHLLFDEKTYKTIVKMRNSL